MLVDAYPLLSGTRDELISRLGIAPDHLELVYLAPASFLAEEYTTTNSDSLPE